MIFMCNRECFEAILMKLEPTQNDIEIEKLEDMTKKKKSTVIESKYEPYVCTICNVVCAHPSVFESHHKGRKHVAKFKKHIDVSWSEIWLKNLMVSLEESWWYIVIETGYAW